MRLISEPDAIGLDTELENDAPALEAQLCVSGGSSGGSAARALVGPFIAELEGIAGNALPKRAMMSAAVASVTSMADGEAGRQVEGEAGREDEAVEVGSVCHEGGRERAFIELEPTEPPAMAATAPAVASAVAAKAGVTAAVVIHCASCTTK